MFRLIFSNFWLKFTRLFKPKPKSIKKIRQEINEILSTETIHPTDLHSELNTGESSSNLESIKSEGLRNAAIQILEIVNELEDSFTSESNLSKKLESLQELKIELETLEQKASLLRYKLGQLNPINESNINHIIVQVDSLYSYCNILEEAIHGTYSIPKFSFEVRLNDFESIVNSLSLKSIFQKKEKLRLNAKVAENKYLSGKLTELEQLINNIKFDAAKSLIKELSSIIGISDVKATIRLSKLKTKLEQKESDYLIRKSAPVITKINEEAAELGIKESETKNRELLEQKEQIDQERLQIQKIQLEKKRELSNFLMLKYNWMDFKEHLDSNNINEFYHFTDKANLKSIIKEGGLYSWDYCDKKQIHIHYPGGNTSSRALDKIKKLEDFVRLSFVREHPMKFMALKDKRIHHPITLKIKTEVCYFQETKFSTKNANSNDTEIGNNIIDLKNVKFEITKLPSYLELSIEQKQYFQAEILVKRWIPLEYITNLSDFTS